MGPVKLHGGDLAERWQKAPERAGDGPLIWHCMSQATIGSAPAAATGLKPDPSPRAWSLEIIESKYYGLELRCMRHVHAIRSNSSLCCQLNLNNHNRQK